MKMTSISPLDNRTIVGEIETSTNEEVVDAVNESKKAFQFWSKMPLKERITYLREVVNLFR